MKSKYILKTITLKSAFIKKEGFIKEETSFASFQAVLLELLLEAEVVAVTATLLTAVGGADGEASVALTADLLLPVVLLGEGHEGGLHDTTTEAEHEVQGGLLLDVVVSQGAALLELLAGEDEALLIRGDALLILDLSLDVLDGIVGLDLEGNGLAGQSLHEDLHNKILFAKSKM